MKTYEELQEEHDLRLELFSNNTNDFNLEKIWKFSMFGEVFYILTRSVVEENSVKIFRINFYDKRVIYLSMNSIGIYKYTLNHKECVVDYINKILKQYE